MRVECTMTNSGHSSHFIFSSALRGAILLAALRSFAIFRSSLTTMRSWSAPSNQSINEPSAVCLKWL